MKETITSLMGIICSRCPERTAVVDDSRQVTYAQLGRDSDCLAHAVLDITGPENSFVIMMLPYQYMSVVAVIGIQKSGNAYIPVSPTYPIDRINYIFHDSCPKVLITTSDILKQKRAEGHLELCGAQVLLVDRMDFENGNSAPIDRCEPDTRVMMMYTSGTTGLPKGVSHKASALFGISHFTMIDYPLDYDGPWIRFAIMVDLAFIVGAASLFTPLAYGGTLFMPDQQTRTDMGKMLAYIKANDINVMFMPSPFGVAMLNYFDLPLKRLVLGGEKVTGINPGRIPEGLELFNGYGMSEIIALKGYRIKGNEDVYPIGTPMDSVTAYVLDDELNSVTPGHTGQLCLCSDKLLCIEYYHLPEMMKEHFIECPFEPGKRMFLTGDRVLVREDGQFIHCGRVDNMIKLRGLRIETGEIENVALAMPAITGTACTVKTVLGEDQLCLYYTASEQINKAELKDMLGKKLAAYMIPAFFIQVERFSYNERGKINRKALPEPSFDTGTEMVTPLGENETLLFNLASSMLKTDKFGVTDNLFALGLNSMMAIRLCAEASAKGLNVRPTDIMLHKSIRETLKAGVRMCYWFNPFDEKKPVLVVVHGITMTNDTYKKMMLWSEQFSVLAIEPINEHYHYIFEGETADEITDFYNTLIEINLPENKRIFGIVGISFAGLLAYKMAVNISERFGYRPNVYLGDTWIDFSANPFGLDLEDPQSWIKIDPANSPELAARLALAARITNTISKLPHYEGKVTLLNATQVMEGMEGKNQNEWSKLSPELEVIDVDDNHMGLCVNEKHLPVFREMIVKDLGTIFK